MLCMFFIALMCVGLVSAEYNYAADSNKIIKMGELTSSNVDISNIQEKSTPLPGSGGSDFTLMSFDYSADAVIDISKMSDSDRNALEKALLDKNTTLTLNMTSDSSSISMTMYQDIDSMTIEGDTLHVKDSGSQSTGDVSGSVELKAVELESSGVKFITTD